MPRLDPELQYLLDRKAYFEKNPEEVSRTPGAVPDPKQILNISIRFKGHIDPIKQQGFTPNSIIGEFSYGSIKLEDLHKLVANPNVISIEKQRRNEVTLDKSVPDTKADQVWSVSNGTFTGFSGKNVIVAIIDTGIEFKHEAFRNPDGTSRILRIWDQTLTVTGAETTPQPITDVDILNPTGAVTPPTISVAYGVEYTQAMIDQTLQNAGTLPRVRHKDDDSHGTHVAGIAAGNGRQGGNCHGGYHYIGMAPDADIVVVRMWGLSENDSSTAPAGAGGVSTDALAYVLNLAKHVFNRPVVINNSYGRTGLQLNGQANDCQLMDAWLNNANNDEGFAIVFAAGNDGANKFHAKGTAQAGTPGAIFGLRFKISDADTSLRTITILYSGVDIRARLTSPLSNGAHDATDPGFIDWQSNANSSTSNSANGAQSGAITPSVTLSNVADQISVTVNPGGGSNAAGDWLLELQDTANTATNIEAFTRGRDSDAKSPRFKDSVSKQTTLLEQASGREVITVGAYSTYNSGNLASFSGRGPTLDGRAKPEIAAPGVSIFSAALEKTLTCANCCCDCCHDFYINKDGTSMAAPHVTGAVALMFQKKPDLTHTQIKTNLAAHAGAKPAGADADDIAGWGAGKLDIKATVNPMAGGGGITGPHSPYSYYKPTYERFDTEYQEDLIDRFQKSKRGTEFISLFKKYFIEIRDLINTNRRVATVWHKSKGPQWIRASIRAAHMPELPLSFVIDGFSLRDGINRMLEILKRYGSAMLVQDLNKYEDDLQLLKEGMNVYDLMEVVTEPNVMEK